MKIHASVIPAFFIRRQQDGRWMIADTLSKVTVQGDELTLPGGLPFYLRLAIYGSGRCEGVIRLTTFNDGTVDQVKTLVEQEWGFDVPPSPQSGEHQATIFEAAMALPITRLFPHVAASSLGSPIQTTFILEVTSRDFQHEEVLTSTPIILCCMPAMKEQPHA